MQETSKTLLIEREHPVLPAGRRWLRANIRLIRRAVYVLTSLVVIVAIVGLIYLASLNSVVQLKLGDGFAQGVGLLPQDQAQAAAWYAKAAAQDEAKAEVRLATMLATGTGVAEDQQAAITWYGKAAIQGDAEAQYRLGMVTLDGHGVPQDITQGLTLLRKSADQGNALAAYRLGNIYAKGLGANIDGSTDLAGLSNDAVAPDNAAAVHWYGIAAVGGNVHAQSALGIMYFDGQGVSANPVTAYTLEALAVAHGLTVAKGLRDQMAEKLTADQMLEVQPFIENWVVGQPFTPAH